MTQSTRTGRPVALLPEQLRKQQTRAPRVIGGLTYLVGLMDIASGLAETWRDRLHFLASIVPGALGDAASAATLVSGILLVVLAHALRRRKRRAWRATVVLLGISVALHVLRLHPGALVVSLAVLVALIFYRDQFRALGDPTTRWRAVRAFVALLATSLVLGMLLLTLVGGRVRGGRPSFGDSLLEVLAGLVGADGPLTFTTDRTTDLVGSVLFGLGLMTFLTTAYLALRAPQPRARPTPSDVLRMRELLHRHPDSLGYFNLREDKSVVWSDSGKAALAYRVVSGVMLASGDPLGDPEAWPGAIENFLAEAEAHAWTPAVLASSERAGTVWTRETGFSAIELGDEAVVDTRSFSLEGRAMRNVRQMVRRVQKQGYAVDLVRCADMDPADRRRALADAAAWRGSDTERGFSMALGRIADPKDPAAVFVAARQEGRVRAFLQLVPWGERGLSLDVMRRDRSAEPGLNELLIAETLRAAPTLGVERVSLNFAAFRSALARGERLGAGPVLRVWRSLLLFASRWFQIETLYRFNAKFQPSWQPRFLIYPNASDLPRVALAALEAEAFLSWPRLHLLKGGPR